MCIGYNKMKKLFLGTILLALVLVFPAPTMARVDVDVSISLPPPIVFAAPPEVVVIPETYVYVVPDCRCGHLLLQWLVVASVGRAMVSLAEL